MCTGIRFTSTDGAMYLGRNLDWSTPFGEHIVITPKGYPLAKAFPEESTTKPAGHAIIGMGITDQGYPLYFDCGNDAGLAVAGLNFPGYAQYEETPVRGKTNVAAYEFPAWITSNFSTVDEKPAYLPECYKRLSGNRSMGQCVAFAFRSWRRSSWHTGRLIYYVSFRQGSFPECKSSRQTI